MIISSEILYARKILIPNSRLSWISHSLYVSNYVSYPSLPDRSFKKNANTLDRSEEKILSYRICTVSTKF